MCTGIGLAEEKLSDLKNDVAYHEAQQRMVNNFFELLANASRRVGIGCAD